MNWIFNEKPKKKLLFMESKYTNTKIFNYKNSSTNTEIIKYKDNYTNTEINNYPVILTNADMDIYYKIIKNIKDIKQTENIKKKISFYIKYKYLICSIFASSIILNFSLLIY